MKELLVVQNVANMMTKPDPDSALDSQAIAGTIVRAERNENNYCYVQTPDLYYGWIAQSRLAEVWDQSAYETICIKTLFAQVFSEPHEGSSLITKLVIDTRLPATKNKVEPFVEILLPNKQKGYVHKRCVESWSTSSAADSRYSQRFYWYAIFMVPEITLGVICGCLR